MFEDKFEGFFSMSDENCSFLYDLSDFLRVGTKPFNSSTNFISI